MHPDLDKDQLSLDHRAFNLAKKVVRYAGAALGLWPDPGKHQRRANDNGKRKGEHPAALRIDHDWVRTECDTHRKKYVYRCRDIQQTPIAMDQNAAASPSIWQPFERKQAGQATTSSNSPHWNHGLARRQSPFASDAGSTPPLRRKTSSRYAQEQRTGTVAPTSAGPSRECTRSTARAARSCMKGMTGCAFIMGI